MGKGNFEIVMTTWSKSDWKRFYEAARRPWRHRRPPRPVYPTGLNRVLPAIERSEEHTSELQSRLHLVCRLLLEKKKTHLRLLHTTTPHTPSSTCIQCYNPRDY